MVDTDTNSGYTFPALGRLRMKDIYKTLAEKQKQLELLQREIDALRLAAKILGDESVKTSPEGKPSQPQMAVAVLEANGKPMHVHSIVEQIHKKFGVKIKTNNLAVLLYRYAQRGKHFYKDVRKGNTYGLIRWQAIAPQQEESSRAVQ